MRNHLQIRYRRGGYTLLEILVATSLSLFLMYGIAAVFSQIGSLMTQTQNVMGMSNSLRATRDRLAEDLSLLTVPKLVAPSSQYGFFCYHEGLGADDRTTHDLALSSGCSFSVEAINTETGGPDSTVGDTDDILSFTIKAKDGEWFRGRFLVVIDESHAEEQIIESQYAEVVWFMRGTTLYRRILLIVPDDVLQKSMEVFCGNTSDIPDIRAGYGFFRYYDVSVHLDYSEDPNGRIVANTLADLSNRKNRYGIWSSPVTDEQHNGESCYLNRHGVNGAWYWLRMPTLLESMVDPKGSSFDATKKNKYFRAGVSFGNDDELSLADDSDDPTIWRGLYQELRPSADAVAVDYWNTPTPWDEVDADSGDLLYPYNLFGGSLFTQDVILTNVLSFDVKVWDDSVGEYIDLGNKGGTVQFLDGSSYTPNVLLGNNTGVFGNADTFASFGRYSFMDQSVLGNVEPLWGTKLSDNNRAAEYRVNSLSVEAPFYLSTPFLPAVFDTWTEDYEKEHLQNFFPRADETASDVSQPDDYYTNVTRRRGFTIADIPVDGSVTSAQLPDYPPPYDKELKSLSIELRVFDPVSRAIRNTTLSVDLTH